MNNRSIFDVSYDRSRGGSIHAEGDAADAIGYAVAAVVLFVGIAWSYARIKKDDEPGKPARKEGWW